MKRGLWIAGVVGLFVAGLGTTPVAAQTPTPPPVRVYQVNHNATYDCEVLPIQGAQEVFTLTVGSCMFDSGTLNEQYPGDGIGFKVCSVENESGASSPMLYTDFYADLTTTYLIDGNARIRAFGSEVMDAAQGGIVELMLSSKYTPVIEPVAYPEIAFEVNTYELDESGSTQWHLELCLGDMVEITPTPMPTLTPTPGIPSSVDYGQIGQIIDIDLGLDIVEKLVGYIGAANIRDYIALAFALAALVALFKAPTSSQ